MAQSQMISKGSSGSAPENALYQGGTLNHTSYMEEGGELAHDDSLLTAGLIKDDEAGGGGGRTTSFMQNLASSKASPRTSGQFRTIQPPLVTDRDINSALLFDADPKLPVSRKLAALDPSVNPRNLHPSQRNKVILTRSVDFKDSRSHVFGGQNARASGQQTGVQGGGVITARMHLNRNTTLELIDSVSKHQQQN